MRQQTCATTVAGAIEREREREYGEEREEESVAKAVATREGDAYRAVATSF